MRISIIGGGHLGRALERGLKAKGHTVEMFGRADRPLNLDVDVVLLSVKPKDMRALCEEIASLERAGGKRRQEPLFVSVAAGIRIATLERWLPAKRVGRAMPNLAVALGEGLTAYTLSRPRNTADAKTLRTLFDALGGGMEVDEPLLDLATGLSGSAVAYYFYFAHAMETEARRAGMPAAQAREMARRTLLSAAAMARASDEPFEALMGHIATPGGTTEAALKGLEEKGVGKAIGEAVELARARSRKIGEESR